MTLWRVDKSGTTPTSPQAPRTEPARRRSGDRRIAGHAWCVGVLRSRVGDRPLSPQQPCPLSRTRESSSQPASLTDRPAAIAASRVSRAGLALGGFGLASAVLLIVRLFESWRVTARGASHQVAILGLRLSYPAANADAIVIVVLAALGSVVAARALHGMVRELAASRRFHQCLATQPLEPLRGGAADRRPQPSGVLCGPVSTADLCHQWGAGDTR